MTNVLKNGNRSSNRRAANGLVFFRRSMREFRLLNYKKNYSADEYKKEREIQ